MVYYVTSVLFPAREAFVERLISADDTVLWRDHVDKSLRDKEDIEE